MTDAKRLTLLQRRTLALCMVGYTVSYLLRANLSAVLDQLMEVLSISRTMAGTIGTLYFWLYAVGQLVNGYLAERLNPAKMVATGLFLSVCLNASMGLARSYPLALVLWGLNGYSLSMIWTPTFKILTNWFSKEAYRRLAVWITLPTTVGYMISWSALRAIASRLSWQYAFFLPALCGALFLIAWALLLRPTRASAGLAPDADDAADGEGVGGSKRRSAFRLLIEYSLLYVAILSIALGMARESLNLWGPTLIADLTGQRGATASLLFSIGIPAAGTVGILSVGALLKRCGGSSRKALMLLLSLCAACAGLVFFIRPGIWPTALLLMCTMAGLCGANSIITAFLPTGFVRYGIAAQVSGMLNFTIYLGAGFGGNLSGLMSDRFGWHSLYLLWALLSLLACLAAVLWGVRLRQHGRG